ncbi:unnamed protein product [Cuscuta epithymum]|uniref:Reverse transcriptase domain-containing protein n=1 Tax=Cuscuta epithymum TaxID=186058 RepID=A0AAV0D709_9ASTE|nr:unnamed protein product [Cuscuta epithymum]
MIVLAWNVRGLGKPSKQNSVVNIIRTNNISIACFLETKMSTLNFNRLVTNRWPGWLSTTNFDLINGGRMGMIWNPSLTDCVVIEVGKQFMHCKFVCKTTQIPFFITFVYALYTVVERRDLWEHLAQVGSNIKAPWMIMGDLNCVCSTTERLGSALPSAYLMRDLLDFKGHTGMVDAPSTGEFFTWNKGTVWAKLDRVLINSSWSQHSLDCRAHFHEMEPEFDHTAIVATILKNSANRAKPFKFFNMWIKHPKFSNIVAQVWGQHIGGSAQFSLVRKLKLLKAPLKELNKMEFGHISMKAKEAKEDYKRLHKLSLVSTPTGDEINDLASAKKRAIFLCEAETSFYQQKAKAIHILEADKSTKYFHAIVKKNIARNSIASIQMADGNLTTSLDQVGQEFVNFFTTLFGTTIDCLEPDVLVMGNGPKLDSITREDLVAPISSLEIKNALFDIGNDKAPGPDGYSSAFFKTNWPLIGDEVIMAVKEFFSSGKLLKQVNHTIIALIPKTSHAPTVTDYRPISCTNVIYKVITKILANRINPCLSSIVDPAQGAFVEGRLMFDNIFLAQELVRGYTRKRISPRCMIKVDLRKAYDTISWKFLEAVLNGLNFHPRFIGWVMECVTNASFSISLNGSLFGWFKGKRGIRQGDPVSPHLFVLCLEYFSRLLKLRTQGTGFNYHPLCSSLSITHLAYADDLMLFSRGDIHSIKILIKVLEDFGEVSGLKVNHGKSNIFVGGVADYELKHILDLVDFGRGTFPVKYLGIPLAPLKISVAQYSPLLDTITDFLNAWNTKSISYAGKLELIRSVVQGVQSFWLQVFPVPRAIVDRIVSICRIFLWGGKYSKVAWDDICLPKNEGGLGIHNAKVWNEALLTKTLWNIHKKEDTLWVRWVNGVYLKGRTVWEFSPHSRDSQLMKKLCLIRKNICQKFNNTNEAIMALNNLCINGKISSAKVYDLLRTKGTSRPWMNFIWKGYIPPKFSFTVWLAFRNRLPTQDNLAYLYMVNRCDLCKGGLETIPHLFFLCSFACRVWTRIRDWIGIKRQMTTLEKAVKWIRTEHRGALMKSKAIRLAFCATIYWLWHTRNASRFEDTMKTEEDVVAKIKHVVYKILYNMYPYELINF